MSRGWVPVRWVGSFFSRSITRLVRARSRGPAEKLHSAGHARERTGEPTGRTRALQGAEAVLMRANRATRDDALAARENGERVDNPSCPFHRG